MIPAPSFRLESSSQLALSSRRKPGSPYTSGMMKNRPRVKPGVTGVRVGMTLCIMLVMLLTACDSSEKAAREMPPLLVRVTQSTVQDVALTTEMVGTTMGTQDVPIRTRVEGYLETMEFEEGTFVKKGDMLYTIDAQPFQAKLVAAQSQLAGSQTTLAKTQADLARIRPLAEINAVSEQDLDSAVAQEAAARANVRASEANVELAEIELGYTRIHRRLPRRQRPGPMSGPAKPTWNWPK